MPKGNGANDKGTYTAFDELLVRAHVAMIHKLAEAWRGRGKLIVASYGEDPIKKKKLKPEISHHEIGDIDGMVRFIHAMAAAVHRNIYIALAVYQPDLKRGKRGTEKDIVAVFGFVGDFDDADAKRWAERLPVPANYVIETSRDRFQAMIFFKPISPAEAKPLAKGLKDHADCDHATADIDHVWRVPGVRNWPNQKKVNEGREREPQPVKVIKPWDGTLTDIAVLPKGEPEPEAGGIPFMITNAMRLRLAELGYTPEQIKIMTPAEAREILSADQADNKDPLPPELHELVYADVPEGERSEYCFNKIYPAMFAHGYSDETIADHIEKCPAGGHFDGNNKRKRLLDDIARCRQKAGTVDFAPQFSEMWLALRFVAEHGADLRYTAKWNKWHRWTGTYWREDDILATFDAVRLCCQRAAMVAKQKKSSLASAKTVAGVVTLVRANPRIATYVDLWDADPMLLGTPGGTVDLRTGKLREARREDYITKQTAVAPGGDCPRFKQFLDEITCGDKELQEYHMRHAGYCLTGHVIEHSLSFWHGVGFNGKDTLAEALIRMLGDYAASVPMSMLIQTKHQEHPTEIASLRGVRFAVASETEDGARWNTARIKLLTGGGMLKARYMRGDYFDFKPTHKLTVLSNSRPLLGHVDTAIKERLHLSPFRAVFTDENGKRDPRLWEKLESEWSGILKLAIEGCLEWQRLGLAQTPAMLAARDEYIETMDDTARWLDERCEIAGHLFDSRTELWKDWATWAKENGRWPGTAADFYERLEKRGFKPHKKVGDRCFLGVCRRGFWLGEDDELPLLGGFGAGWGRGSG